MSALEALAPALGSALRVHEPLDVDGVAVGATLAPPDADALADALRRLGDAGLAALPRGAGTQLGLGNPPSRADCLLDLSAFAGVDELDADEGVCHAGAATPLALLRARADEAGWELPLDDAGRGGTLGGAIASASLAPRALGFGRVRDVLLGCEVMLADGTPSRCGGRVVKNVTGYDMAKLYTGSLGGLALVLGAWLRLRPQPELLRVLGAPPARDVEALRVGVDAARRVTARSCVLASDGPSLRAWIELAGDAVSVERDAAALAEQGFAPAEPASRDAAAARRFAAPPRTLRFAVSFLPSGAERCVDALREAGAERLVLPELGLAIAHFDAADPERAFEAAARAAREGGGRQLCEHAPAEAKRERDVFAAPPGEAALTRALKERFDPGGVLSPGRLAGRT